MCELCGCGEATTFHQHEIEPRKIKLEEMVLNKNDRLAERNRGIFEAMKVIVLNLVSSPGAGKTTLLEQTIRNLKDELNIGVIEGDQQTDRDAKRIEPLGVKVHQINTLDACHLDAHMIRHALDNFPLNELDLLFIENVGNLICPGAFDLGEDFRIVVLSITEGEDKPIKYPGIFLDSPLVLINKIDLLDVLEFDLDQCLSYVKKVNSQAQCLCVSAKTGQGMDSWYEWIKQKVKEKGVKK
jgi:hydrogenase nickel incorporation protein HypB